MTDRSPSWTDVAPRAVACSSRDAAGQLCSTVARSRDVSAGGAPQGVVMQRLRVRAPPALARHDRRLCLYRGAARAVCAPQTEPLVGSTRPLVPDVGRQRDGRVIRHRVRNISRDPSAEARTREHTSHVADWTGSARCHEPVLRVRGSRGLCVAPARTGTAPVRALRLPAGTSATVSVASRVSGAAAPLRRCALVPRPASRAPLAPASVSCVTSARLVCIM